MRLSSASSDDSEQNRKGPSQNKKKKRNPKTFTTLSDLSKFIASNPNAVRDTQAKNRSKPKSGGKTGGGGGSSSSAKRKRTRKSVRERGDRPQQSYVYAGQKNRGRDGNDDGSSTASGGDDSSTSSSGREATPSEHPNTILARNLGMRLTPTATQSQGCYPDASSSPHAMPKIVGSVRVGEDEFDTSSGSMAYVLYKPAGWCILDGKGAVDLRSRISASGNSGARTAMADNRKGDTTSSKGGTGGSGKRATTRPTLKGNVRQVKVIEDDQEHVLEFDENDLAGVMSSEELEELKAEGGLTGLDFVKGGGNQDWFGDGDDDDDNDDRGPGSSNEVDLSSVMSPAEIAELEAEGGLGMSFTPAEETVITSPTANAAGAPISRPDALQLTGNPSLVTWLKNHMASSGTPIRGGKYWRAVTGAVDVDDSGLVVLCPKEKVDSVYIDYTTYVAVVGNAEKLAPRGKVARERLSTYDRDDVDVDIVSKLRTGRGEDTVLTAAMTLSDGFSSTSDVVKECQAQFADGIRGDPSADPLDRRAQRRLVHCGAISVSSLIHDDDVEAMEDPPDDVAVLSERGEWGQDFVRGSYLGRTELRNDELTTAYREINGAADGYPGWIVDRYDKWLLVQHDEAAGGRDARGPLPSIHDDNTAGVYYFPTNPDRSTIASVKPQLLEGQSAPDVLPIRENGITYHVNIGDSFSTGMFLDQRPRRAWLARHCDTTTRVLNCFAHCGAFSVAAATAGASTVSLDLDKKWLDRIQPQMEANGITDFDRRHDTIYGDCFDWLARLGKRGEKYDIVILDPPSTSVGGKKKKRWSVKNDMDELVALAAPLVKSGGLLWTTTNSASIRVDKFAKMCKKGLDRVDLGGREAKLERIAPMAVDFSSIGPQPVKNLVWRIP